MIRALMVTHTTFRQTRSSHGKSSRPDAYLTALAAVFAATCLSGILHAEVPLDPLEEWRRMEKIQPHGYVCGFAKTAPVIDGRLDDSVWQTAPWTEDFADIEGSVR